MTLKQNLTNPAVEKGVLDVIFYVGFFIACYLLGKAAPSGSCNAGLGFLLFLLLPFITPFLLIVYAFKLFLGKKENTVTVIMHAVALITYLLIFYSSIY